MAVTAFKHERKIEKVGLDTNLALNITLSKTRALYGNSMLTPKEVYQFAKSNPKAFRKIIESTELSIGVAVSTNGPLGDFIRNGNLEVSVHKQGNYAHQLIIPESKMPKNMLKAENVILLVKGGYTIDGSGHVYTIILDKEALGNLGQCLQLFSKPPKSGWYAQVDGMPVGNASNQTDPNALYYMQSTGLGAVTWHKGVDIQGSDLYASDWRGIEVGSGVNFNYGALVKGGLGLKGLVANAKEELGDKAGSATRKLFETIVRHA